MEDKSIFTTKLRTSGSSGRQGPSPDAVETIAKARAMRAEHAMAAAYLANRAEQARAAGRRDELGRWTKEYRRSVAACRVLGERIRGESARAEAADPGASRVTPFLSHDREGSIPTPGEAA